MTPPRSRRPSPRRAAVPAFAALCALSAALPLTVRAAQPPANPPTNPPTNLPAAPPQTPQTPGEKPAETPAEKPAAPVVTPATPAPSAPAEKAAPDRSEKKPEKAPAPAATAATPATPTSEAGAPVLVTVKRFRDAGGGADRYRTPDGKPLTERLAGALTQVLTEGAGARYAVAGGKAPAAKGAVRLVIEGDLSALETAEDGEARPFLLVTRVYQEGKPRRLVAQFAGAAGSLRGLTGNVGGQAGASEWGIVGELAERIGRAAVAVTRSGDAAASALAGIDSVVPSVGFAPDPAGRPSGAGGATNAHPARSRDVSREKPRR